MTTVSVKASKDYNVHIKSGLLFESGERIREVCGGEKAIVVTDDIVDKLYGDKVKKALERAGYSVAEFVFLNGEQSKNINTYISLLNELSRVNLTRTDVVVALGGGVVGDLAGFAAATFLRGVKFVQVPTTLLAMVDSSVGGKTAVNLQSGKNQVGTFYQPDLVLCDYDALETLPENIFRDGCVEMIKHAVIRDAELFERLKQPVNSQFEKLIARNVEIKRDVVALDEKDTGVRQVLNFGHTIGHGVEKLSDYAISHGSAVAIGMIIESRGKCREQIAELLTAYKIPYKTEYTAEQLVKAAFADKKRDGKKITIAVSAQVGECRLESFEVDGKELLELIREGLEASF